MKAYQSKPAKMWIAKWEGGQDEQICEELRAAGWTLVFQQPETEQAEVWDMESDKYAKVPCPSRMVVLGTYRKQVTQLDSGTWLVYHEGESRFNTWDIAPRETEWAESPGDDFKPPTPFTLNADAEPDVLLSVA